MSTIDKLYNYVMKSGGGFDIGQFRAKRKVEKRYYAVVYNRFSKKEGVSKALFSTLNEYGTVINQEYTPDDHAEY